MIPEDLAALAALGTGRPVCSECTREGEFTTASPRHPMPLTVLARREGGRHPHDLPGPQRGEHGNRGGGTLYAGGAAVTIHRCPDILTMPHCVNRLVGRWLRPPPHEPAARTRLVGLGTAVALMGFWVAAFYAVTTQIRTPP